MRIPRSILLGLALVLALASTPASAAETGDMRPGVKASNALYWEGQAALKQSDWSTALRRFQDLENQLLESEPKSVDAALYWQAYALVQAKRTTEARNVIERLRREFPDSRWSRDAGALLAQARPLTALDPESTDDELADIAVEGLLNAPPEHALPLLKKVLASQRSTKVKKRALFVLSQLDTDEAMNVVLDTAKNSRDPELRREAIQMLTFASTRSEPSCMLQSLTLRYVRSSRSSVRYAFASFGERMSGCVTISRSGVPVRLRSIRVSALPWTSSCKLLPASSSK